MEKSALSITLPLSLFLWLSLFLFYKMLFLNPVYALIIRGKRDGWGSEHTLDGRTFPAELHIVHKNLKYGSMGEAVKHKDGIAAVGFFLQLGTYPPLMIRVRLWDRYLPTNGPTLPTWRTKKSSKFWLIDSTNVLIDSTY